jgi:hypothetical protein
VPTNLHVYFEFAAVYCSTNFADDDDRLVELGVGIQLLETAARSTR